MNLQNRIELLQELKKYLLQNDPAWQEAKLKASIINPWFTPEFIELSVNNIIAHFLDDAALQTWIKHYHLNDSITPKNVGIVMAGNIPMVGFHDFLAVFISGHVQTIKLSSKDEVLLKHLVQYLQELYPGLQQLVSFSELLKGCDAYIATGSNNTGRYFDHYFARYPSIIRRNRTSVAIIRGNETQEELEKLSDDIHQFFGLGCRNVTKLYVPEEYDFVPLLQSFHRYKYFADHHKYRNNYDFNLSVQIMNNHFYMTNETTLVIENDALFSPISQVNYSTYNDFDTLVDGLRNHPDLQCIVGVDLPFGNAQRPELMDYADGVDTIQFLLTI